MNQVNNHYHYDQQGLDLTEFSEASGGPRLKAYWDPTGKLWTIGYGHTRNVKEGDTCTPEQANAFLLSDVAAAVYAVKYYVDVELSQEQFDACVDLCFNIGIGNFERSTFLEYINSYNWQGAIDEFAKWDKSGGEVLPGLRSRRNAEMALFLLGTDFTEYAPPDVSTVPAANPNV